MVPGEVQKQNVSKILITEVLYVTKRIPIEEWLFSMELNSGCGSQKWSPDSPQKCEG